MQGRLANTGGVGNLPIASAYWESGFRFLQLSLVSGVVDPAPGPPAPLAGGLPRSQAVVEEHRFLFRPPPAIHPGQKVFPFVPALGML